MFIVIACYDGHLDVYSAVFVVLKFILKRIALIYCFLASSL